MNSFSLIILIACVFGVFCNNKDLKKVATEKCIKESQLSPTEAQNVHSGKYDDASNEVQKVMYCVLKELGVIKNGLLQEPVIVNWIVGDTRMPADKAKEICEKCANFKEPVEVQKMYEIYNCLVDSKINLLKD